MSTVFRIHVLPAQRGDSLWIEYGSEDALKHILIDGGISTTGQNQILRRVKEIGTSLHFELLVVTHIDEDHIQGILEFIGNLPSEVTFGDIWFNGWDQLNAISLEPMGIKDGIRLSEILEANHKATWNKASGGKAISLDESGKVVRYSFDSNMIVTVLGPTHKQLGLLRDHWGDAIESFGVTEDIEGNDEEQPSQDLKFPGLEAMGVIDIDIHALASSQFKEDDKIPNGSSIALALEYDGLCALMLGDAYPTTIASSLRSLISDGRFKADVVKLAHHGSRNNTDRALVSMLTSPTWIFSSNGANNTKHPHKETVARVLLDGDGMKTLVFNYRTKFNDMWDNHELMNEFGYEVVYGDGDSPVTVVLK